MAVLPCQRRRLCFRLQIESSLALPTKNTALIKVSSSGTWNDAYQICCNMNGRMVQPDTEYKYNQLLKLEKHLCLTGPNMWTGVYDVTPGGGDWTWTDGSKVNLYPPWKNQNNPREDQNCLRLDCFGLADKECNRTFQIVCETQKGSCSFDKYENSQVQNHSAAALQLVLSLENCFHLCLWYDTGDAECTAVAFENNNCSIYTSDVIPLGADSSITRQAPNTVVYMKNCFSVEHISIDITNNINTDNAVNKCTKTQGSDLADDTSSTIQPSYPVTSTAIPPCPLTACVPPPTPAAYRGTSTTSMLRSTEPSTKEPSCEVTSTILPLCPVMSTLTLPCPDTSTILQPYPGMSSTLPSFPVMSTIRVLSTVCLQSNVPPSNSVFAVEVSTIVSTNFIIPTEVPKYISRLTSLATSMLDSTYSMTQETSIDQGALFYAGELLDVHNLSSYKRKFISVDDNRPSAITIGVLGILVMASFFVIVLCCDLCCKKEKNRHQCLL
ncbi:uncharacterized protein LOC126815423 [Patella vulgata]|uniref:uncharacterized protein LOC126815423 n=1 Tax=Patella vulgata TaxID=6465 RepID=UPI00217F5CE3|nr:uncharacterized protein LOC126815423 [Patella vulgata]